MRSSDVRAKTNRLSATLAVATSLLGVFVLVGWSTDIEALKTMFGRIVMLPITSIAFLIAGISLWLQSPVSDEGRSRVARLLGIGVLVIGVLMLFQRLSGVTFSASAILFHASLLEYEYRPLGVMASNTAFCLIMIGSALTVLDGGKASAVRPPEILGVVSLLVAFVAILGYLYDVSPLYKIDRQTGMAVSTALGLVMVSLGVLAARPGVGAVSLLAGSSASAALTRRLLITTMVLPVALGRTWLELRRNDVVSREVGVSIFVVAIVTVFLGVIFWTARALRQRDSTQERALKEANEARSTAVAARETAEQANRAKSDFLAVMSHELRTPLNAIRGYAELLEMEISGPLTPDQRTQIERIRRSEHQLLSMIDDLLTFTRIDADHIEYRLMVTPVVSITEKAVVLLDPALRKKDMRFENTVDGDCALNVHADPDKSLQILTNLLVNAVKFTLAGGSVSLSCRSGERRGVRMVLLSVADTGRGIPGDKLESIFEPFVQVEGGLTRTNEGVGLGLAISRSLARDMEGDVEVESVPGQGSVFTLVLPLHDASRPALQSGV